MNPARFASAHRFMALVNDDAFDAAFTAGTDPFKKDLHNISDWFRLRGFSQIVDPRHVQPGDVIVLPVAWPGDLVGVLRDDRNVELAGDDAAEVPVTTLAAWCDRHGADDLQYFRPNTLG